MCNPNPALHSRIPPSGGLFTPSENAKPWHTKVSHSHLSHDGCILFDDRYFSTHLVNMDLYFGLHVLKNSIIEKITIV